MFQDIGVSKDLNEQFKKHLTNSEPLDREYPGLRASFTGGVLGGGGASELVASERDGGSCIRNPGTGKSKSFPQALPTS